MRQFDAVYLSFFSVRTEGLVSFFMESFKVINMGQRKIAPVSKWVLGNFMPTLEFFLITQRNILLL